VKLPLIAEIDSVEASPTPTHSLGLGCAPSCDVPPRVPVWELEPGAAEVTRQILEAMPIAVRLLPPDDVRGEPRPATRQGQNSAEYGAPHAVDLHWDGFRAARAGQNVARDLQMDPSFKALLRKSGYFSAVPPE
jgi:hypothetical protein